MPSRTVTRSAGPSEQFEPIKSAPTSTRRRAACSGQLLSSLSSQASPGNVIEATIGSCETCRTASIAARISQSERNVSRMKKSTPRASSADACSRKRARTRSSDSSSCGSYESQVGPIEPPTKTSLPETSRALRASLTAAPLISATFSSRPKAFSLCRLAPNVLVSMTRAPASMYWRWQSRTRSGCERLSSSTQPLWDGSRLCRSDPIPPSSTRMRSSKAARNGDRFRLLKAGRIVPDRATALGEAARRSARLGGGRGRLADRRQDSLNRPEEADACDREGGGNDDPASVPGLAAEGKAKQEERDQNDRELAELDSGVEAEESRHELRARRG